MSICQQRLPDRPELSRNVSSDRKGPKGPHAQSRKDGKGPSGLGWFKGLTVRVRVKLTSKLQTD